MNYYNTTYTIKYVSQGESRSYYVICVSAYARAYGQHKINIYLSCIIVCFSWKSTILHLSSNDQFVFEQLSNSTFFN